MTLAAVLQIIKGGLVRFRATATGIVVALGAVIVWTITQAGTASESYEKYIEVSEKSKGFIDRYGTEFAKADDTKADLLNNIVFRVRTGVHSSELGADLLCWAAARAKARRPGDGTTALTSTQILRFMDEHPKEFNLEHRSWSWVAPFHHAKHVRAAEYCRSYLDTQPELDVVVAPAITEGKDPAAVPDKIFKSGAAIPEQPLERPLERAQLYVHIASKAQREAAERLNADLSADPRSGGLRPLGVELISPYSGGNEVRYYKPGDKPKAQRLAGLLKCAGEAPPALIVKGYETSPGVARGTLELWISPGAGPSGCSLTAG